MMTGQTTIKSREYLDFIRGRPCSFCVSPAEPHHPIKRLRGISEAGVSQKGSDYLAIPLCRFCHAKIHAGTIRLERVELLELIVVNLVGYLEMQRGRHGLGVGANC